MSRPGATPTKGFKRYSHQRGTQSPMKIEEVFLTPEETRRKERIRKKHLAKLQLQAKMRKEVMTSALVKFAVSDQAASKLEGKSRSPTPTRPQTTMVGTQSSARGGNIYLPRNSLYPSSVSPIKPSTSSRPVTSQ